jgi:high-affinity Fe2+/Pb2+ permease
MRPDGGASARPPLVTAAGILLILSGVLTVLFTVLFFDVSGSALFYVLLTIVIAAITIWAGVQVLQLREQGRMLGLVLAGIGAVFALLGLLRGAPVSVISLALNGFILYALVTSASSFR